MKLEYIEIQDLIISILVLGFAFSFKHWGAQEFNLSIGFSNFILITFLVAFSFLVHELAHRAVAINSQAELRYRAWKFGLILAVIFVFLTNGWFIFAAVGVITIVPLRIYRSGRTKFLGPYERTKIALSGPIANFALAILAAVLFNATNAFVWEKLFVINAWLAVMNLFPFFRNLPHAVWRKIAGTGRRGPAFSAELKGDERMLPQTEGEIIFFGSRPVWIFAFMFVTISCILLYLIKSVVVSLLLAFIIGFILYVVWHYYIEPWSYEIKHRRKPYQYKL